MADSCHHPTSNDGTPGRVLVVEDDASVRRLVSLHLTRGGFRVTEAESAEDARRWLDHADAVVLDRMLPGQSGDALLGWMRADSENRRVPVLMLTARATERDRVGGLDAGADDYLVKPFSAPELVARVRALLRRAPPALQFRLGDLVVDTASGRAFRGAEELALTRREFDLLAHMIEHPGRVFGRTALLDGAWGMDFVGTERTVDQHVAQLRARIGTGWIETVRGRGYRMVDPHAGA